MPMNNETAFELLHPDHPVKMAYEQWLSRSDRAPFHVVAGLNRLQINQHRQDRKIRRIWQEETRPNDNDSSRAASVASIAVDRKITLWKFSRTRILKIVKEGEKDGYDSREDQAEVQRVAGASA